MAIAIHSGDVFQFTHLDNEGPQWELKLEKICIISRVALIGEDPDARSQAAEALRCLSTYDEVALLNKLIDTSINEFALFMALKSYHFIVSNEIGPNERTEVQERMLKRLSEISNDIPRYVVNSFLLVYAAALYLNWRLMIISAEEEGGDTTSVGKRIESSLNAHLNRPLALHAMREILSHFSKEDARSTLRSVRQSFATTVLPYFFTHSVECMTDDNSGCNEEALELCIASLEFIPPAFVAPLIQVNITSEDSLYLHPPEAWLPPMLQCVDFCKSNVIAGDLSDDTEDGQNPFLRCLRLISTVNVDVSMQHPDKDLIQECMKMKNDLFTSLLCCVDELLNAYLSYRGGNILLEMSRMLLNLTERHRHEVADEMLGNVEFIERLARTQEAMTQLWGQQAAMDSENERFASRQEACQNITNFFCILLDNFEISQNGVAGVETYPPRPSPVRVGGPGGAMAGASSTPQNGKNGNEAVIIKHITDSFHCYFDAIVAQCHLVEESPEMSLSEGIKLHSERWLMPVAKMLLSGGPNMTAHVEAALKEAIEEHNICMNLKCGMSVSEEDMTRLMTRSVESLTMNLHTDDFVLAMSHVMLSRLSAIIGVLGIAIQLRGNCYQLEDIVGDNAWLGAVIDFASDFLSIDLEDSLIALSLKSGGTGGSSSPTRVSAEVGEKKFHLGILRSLMFFCSCIQYSAFSQQKPFIELVLTLVSFVLTNHSMCFVLASDAIALLNRGTLHDTNSSLMSSSETMERILDAATSGKIELLKPDLDIEENCPQAKLGISMRKKLFASLVRVLERRAGLKHSHADECFSSLFDLAILGNHTALANIRGFCRGLNNTDFIKIMLGELCWSQQTTIGIEVVEGEKSASGAATNALGTITDIKIHVTSPQHSTALVHTLAKVCDRCVLLEFTNTSTINFVFARVVLKAVEVCIGLHQEHNVTPTSNTVHDIATILASLCSGTWVNLGIMLYYGDHSLEDCFVGAVESLICVEPLDMLSNTKHRDVVFVAVAMSLRFANPSKKLQSTLQDLGVWPRLVGYLVTCLKQTYLQSIVECLTAIFVDSPMVAANMLPYDVVKDVFQEMAVVLSTANLQQAEGEKCVTLLFACHGLCQVKCEAVLEELLEFASAYHRIRIRCLLTMLRNPPTNVEKSYFNVFGGSKVATLHAW